MGTSFLHTFQNIDLLGSKIEYGYFRSLTRNNPNSIVIHTYLFLETMNYVHILIQKNSIEKSLHLKKIPTHPVPKLNRDPGN